jgi:hypothetical protein
LLRRFLAFVLCVFSSILLAACGGGGGGGTQANNAPSAALVAAGDVRADGGQLRASVGGTVRFDAGTSSDPEQDPLTYEWTLVAKPAGSAAPASGSARELAWQPDMLGTFTYALKVSDGKMVSAPQQVSIVVDNTAPTAGVVTAVQFSRVPVQAPVQAATLGATIILDATAATDPDGDPVVVSFEWLTRPAGSGATLVPAGKTARFAADALGRYEVRVHGSDPSGAGFQTNYTFDVANRAPKAVLVANVSPVVANSGQTWVTASVGYQVLLDGSGSSDADGDAITRAWTLTSRPEGSQAVLAVPTGASTVFAPDLRGDYVVVQTVTDARGAQSTYTTTVHVNNERPLAQITTNATPRALPFAPSVLVPQATEVTLRGDVSVDADGDPLTYEWAMDARPAGSTAVLSSGSAINPRFVADTEGAFVFRLRVTDPSGAFSDRTITVQVGTHAPVAVVDREQMTVIVGAPVRTSAAMSFDEDGDVLAYQWSVDARPVGSTAGVALADTAAPAFVPDVVGTYVLAVRVADGKAASIAYVTVRALAQFRSSVPLDFFPLDAKYSAGLDKMVIASDNPNALRVVDPFAGGIASVPLPAPVTSLQLSADGKLAVALHQGSFSLVDLQALAVVRTIASGGAQTDAFVTNGGMVYLIGTRPYGFSEAVAVFNGRTGEKLVQPFIEGTGTFYGTQRGILAASVNRVFFISEGLSPVDVDYFSIDPASGIVMSSGDSPYHGDYLMGSPLYLSGDDQLLFTSHGNWFRTDTLQYRGQLTGIERTMVGFSHFAPAQEALALPGMPSSATVYPYPPDLPAVYKRYTGSLLLPDRDLTLPTIDGAQAYGRKIFHSNNGSHVVLVQTGHARVDGSGASYFVIAR